MFEYYEDLFATISCFIGMLFCFSLSFEKNEMPNMHYAWLYFVLGILMSSAIYLIVNYDYARYLIVKIINGERFSAFADDPNYLSMYICLNLSFIFTLSKLNWIHYITTLIFVILGLLTASKMCILMISIILILGITYNIVQFRNVSRLKYSFISLFSLLSISFIYFDKLVIFLNNLISRAGLEKGTVNANALTTGRWGILSNYIDIMTSNISSLFWGSGLKYYLVFNQSRIAHNTYFDIVFSWGIVGTVVLTVILFLWFKELDFQKKYIYYFPLAALSINLLDLSCLTATMFWWIISFCVNAARESPKKHNEFINERICIK